MGDQVVLSLDRVWRMLGRGLLPAAVLAAVVGVLAYTYTRRLPPTYSSQAVLAVSTNSFDSARLGLPSVAVPPLHVTAYRIAALSDAVLGPTLSQLGAASDPSAIVDLRDRTTVNTDDRAQLVYITVTQGSAEGAARTANAIAAQLVRWDADRTRAALGNVLAPLGDRTADLTGNIALLQSAPVPPEPVAPTPVFTALLAALLAVAAVYAFLLIREAVDPRLYGAEDAARTTRLPLLGLLPRTGGRRGYPPEAGALLLDAIAARYRGSAPRSVLVTTVLPGEGGMQVAAAMAEAATFRGNRTLLVDADPADPRLPTLLRRGAEVGSGLSDYLAEQGVRYRANPMDVGQTQPLYVLYETSPRPRSSRLTLNFAANLAAWREEFDLIVIRSAPFSGSSDAALLATVADGTVLVTSAASVRKRAFLGQLAALQRTGTALLGLVVTHATSDAVSAMPEAGPRREESVAEAFAPDQAPSGTPAP